MDGGWVKVDMRRSEKHRKKKNEKVLSGQYWVEDRKVAR